MPALNDWEYYFDEPAAAGLTFGGQTAYGVLEVEGLAPPDAREEVIEKTSAHGAFVYSENYQARRITISGEIVGTSTSDLMSKLETWRDTFQNQAADVDFEWKYPGQIQKRIHCRPSRRFYRVAPDWSTAYATWVVELVAGDTAIYNTSDVKQSDY